MKKYHKLIIALLVGVIYGCKIDNNEEPYAIRRNRDSLLIHNGAKKSDFVLYTGLASYVRDFHFYDKQKNNLYIYFENKLFDYSIDSDKVSGAFMFGNYTAFNEDSVNIEKVNKKLIYLKTGMYNYLLNESLTKWYNLDKLVNDTLKRYFQKVNYKCNSNILNLDFILKNGGRIKKAVDLDTLKLKDLTEQWDILKGSQLR